MNRLTRILHLEDDTMDAELIQATLESTGIVCQITRVQNRDEFTQALHQDEYDIVLADYRLPMYDGVSALRLAQELRPDLPFIFVSGTLGEDAAIEGFTHGATDYVLKQKLSRLAPAVERALREAENRQERKRAEEALRRLNRELQAISKCNQVLVRAENELSLLSEICRIVCDEAGYRLAWVGYAEHDEAKTVRPVAWAGSDSVYVENVKLSWADNTERGQGPGGTAIRSGETVYIQDFTTDPRMAPWRESALQCGHRSAIGLPLKDESANTFGVLLIYSMAINAFTPDELRLLEELAGDLAFGIVVLRDRIERKRAEETLRESEERYRLVFENSPVSIWEEDFSGVKAFWDNLKKEGVTDIETYFAQHPEAIQQCADLTKIVDVNRAALALHKAANKEELLAGLVNTFTPESFDTFQQELVCLWNGGTEMTRDAVVKTLAGDPRNVTIYFSVSPGYEGTFSKVLVSLTDITERKQGEKTRYEAQQVFRTLVENSPDIIARYDRDCRRTYVNPVYLKTAQIPRQELLATAPIQRSPLPATSAMVLQNLLRKVLDSGVAEAVDVIWPKEDNIDHWYNVYASPEFGREGQVVSVMTISRDITERKWTEEALHAKVVALQILADIDQAIISSLDLDQVLGTLLEKVREATQSEACSVALVDQASGDLVFRQAVGGATDEVIGLRLRPGEGLAGWVAQHRQSVLVPDAASDARARNLKGGSGFVTRDLIGVPLMAHEQVTGVIELVNKRSGIFGEDDRHLLEAVAAQAVIAIENARLFEETRRRLAEVELLYQSGLVSSQILEPKATARKIIDLLEQKLDWHHIAIRSYHPQDDTLELLAFNQPGLDSAAKKRAVEERLNALISKPGQGITGWVVQNFQTVRSADLSHDARYAETSPGLHSGLYVPMKLGLRMLGVISIESELPNAFDEAHERLVSTLAGQAASALENARLFEETRRHADEMSIVSQVALVGAAGRPFDETVVRATNALSRLWPEASLGFLFVDETRQSLRRHPSYQSVVPEITPAIDIPLDQGIVSWAMRERQPIRVGDVRVDSCYLPAIPGIRSEMAAPLVVGQRAIGVVNVESPRLDAFSGDDLRLLTTIAGQLATIFEKARLDAELAEHAALLEQRVAERTRELNVANEQLKELDHLKDQFVSNVSHELRTPLANLKLYLSLLERGRPEKRAEYMQTLHREQQRLDRMIEDLLDLSRLDLGVTQIQPIPVDLSLLLSQLIADRSALAAEHQLVLDYRPDDALPLALVDPVMLTEVITNLVGNAINYTPAGGMVTVSTAAREEASQTWATFTVQDDGLGISAKELPHLFERFYRGEVGRKASAPGTGLGLAISQEIVEKMGGRITVESEPGHGAAFTVWLKPGA